MLWKTVYELRDDAASLEGMQQGSLDPESDVGLRITHGLIGSEEWWSNIAKGVLPLQTAHGDISGYWSGRQGHGPPEFELKQRDGSRSKWILRTPNDSFIVGRPAEVDFVFQELKTPFGGTTRTKVGIVIRLGVRTGHGT